MTKKPKSKRLVIEVDIETYDTVKMMGNEIYRWLSATKTARAILDDAIKAYREGEYD